MLDHDRLVELFLMKLSLGASSGGGVSIVLYYISIDTAFHATYHQFTNTHSHITKTHSLKDAHDSKVCQVVSWEGCPSLCENAYKE